MNPRLPLFAALAAVGLTALAACSAKPRATTPLAPYVGTWQGRSFDPITGRLVVRWTLVQRSDSSGTFTFGNETASTPTRVVGITRDSVLIELTEGVRAPRYFPFEVSLQLLGAVRGDSMTGVVLTRLPEGSLRRSPMEAARIGRPVEAASARP